MTANNKSRSEIAGIKVGVSSCLLGNEVRYDANHKHDRYLTDILGKFVSFVPVCPEVEIGMGVPREAVVLEGDPSAPRLVGNRSGKDWTDRMNTYSTRRVSNKNIECLSGFVLKKKSPSCGMERVKVHIKPGTVKRSGVGLFVAALLKRFPDLPVEDEGRLNDAALRENFIERVFAYKRLQNLFARPFARGQVIDFHAAHKFMLLAHSPEYYRRLGRLVAGIKNYPPASFKNEYLALFMRALKFRATVKKNTNVLQHIAGYLKDRLDGSEKVISRK